MDFKKDCKTTHSYWTLHKSCRTAILQKTLRKFAISNFYTILAFKAIAWCSCY